MTNTTNFTSILAGMTMGEMEKPKPLPVGSYAGLITGLEYVEVKKRDNSGTANKVVVKGKIVAPLSDVDAAAIEAFGGMPKLVDKPFKIDFFLTPESAWRLQEFVLEHVELDLRGQTFDQGLPQIVNNQVGIHINHRPDDKKPDVIYSEVDKTFKM